MIFIDNKNVPIQELSREKLLGWLKDKSEKEKIDLIETLCLLLKEGRKPE